MGNRYGLVAGLFFLCLIPLFAQQAADPVQESKKARSEKKNYFLKETDQGVDLVQRLSWEALDDILGLNLILNSRIKKRKHGA